MATAPAAPGALTATARARFASNPKNSGPTATASVLTTACCWRAARPRTTPALEGRPPFVLVFDVGTGLYNVLQALREGRALNPKEKQIHNAGLVGVL